MSRKLPASSPLKDPAYKAAVVDVLGLIAYSELTAFGRMALDAKLAPTLSDVVALSRMAVDELAHYSLLEARLIQLEVDPAEAMQPFVEAVEKFQEQTRPADFLEGLVKVYVGDGIAADFFGEIAGLLDRETAAIVREAISAVGVESYIVDTVRAAIEADFTVQGRLALWARRLVGEALSQAQRVAVDRSQLSSLIASSGDGLDLTEVTRMLARITEGHTARVAALGLS